MCSVGHAQVKRKAFECIAGVASLYYDKLQPYITALFNLTLTCIRDEATSESAFQAIEFWNTLCDEVSGSTRTACPAQGHSTSHTRPFLSSIPRIYTDPPHPHGPERLSGAGHHRGDP